MGAIDKKISELEELTTPAVNDLLAIVDVSVADFQTKYITTTNLVTGGIIAPADPQYVTLAVHAGLPNERVLTGTANQIIVTDGGAGGAVTLSTPQDIDATATPTFAGMTITGINGIDYNPGADLDVDIITIGVTGTPLIFWDESDDDFNFNKGLDITDSIDLQDTTTDISGVINKGGNRFIHNFHHPVGGGALPDGRNTFIGELAGNFTMGSTATNVIHSSNNFAGGFTCLQANTTGYRNVAIGASALYSNTTGDRNVAIGYRALYSNISGRLNFAIGDLALEDNTDDYNFAIGVNSLRDNTTGTGNVALGASALQNNTEGDYNVALGAFVMQENLTTIQNVAVGYYALDKNIAHQNVGVGSQVMRLNTTGTENVALGYQAGYYNQTGSANTRIGYYSGRGVTGNSNSYNTFLGKESGRSITTGSSNIFLGHQSGYNQTNLSNLLIIDNQQRADVATELSNAIIYGVMAAAPASQTLRLNGRVGVMMTPTVAQFDVIQPDNTAAIPVASLEQTDIDQVLMKIIGTAEAASADRTLVADSDYGTPGALVGWVQVEVQDDGNRIADGDYYVPLHAVPT